MPKAKTKRAPRLPKTMADAVDRLVNDTQRMQFLEDHQGEVIHHGGTWSVTLKEPFIYVDRQPTLRDAVDAARVARADRLRLRQFPFSA